MGGWTSVALVYPICNPPTITSERFADFLDAFLSLGVTSHEVNFRSLDLKYGDSIDQDERTLFFEVPDENIPGLSSIDSQDLDFELRGKGLDQISPLRGRSGTIYRAHAGLGCIIEGAADRVHALIGDENYAVRLFDWSLDIEPLTIESPVTGEELLIGWISLSLGGQGYSIGKLNPADLVSVVRELPECQKVEDLVRSFWPVSPRRPSREVRRSRIAMGHYWTGVSVDEPLDWFWTFVGSY